MPDWFRSTGGFVRRHRIVNSHVGAEHATRHDLYRRPRENVERDAVVEFGRNVERPLAGAVEVVVVVADV